MRRASTFVPEESMRTRRLLAAVAACCALVAGSAPEPARAAAKPRGPSAAAAAKEKTKKKGADKTLENAAEIEAQLGSADPGEVAAGLEALRAAGKDGAPLAPLGERLLRDGLPPELAKAALAALGAVGQESSSRPIRAYALHRDPVVRRAAVKALIGTKGPEAVQALKRALRDSDANVRGTAASGLAALGATDQVADLFVALDHKVAEAAAAIGQLCSAEQCEKFVSKTGQIGFDVMTSGFDQIVFRKPAEIDDEQKIRIIGRIRELGTGDVNKFLKDVQGRWPAGWSKKVKQSIDQAVQATEGSAGTRKPERSEAP
jgi:HEAT repeat protein